MTTQGGIDILLQFIPVSLVPFVTEVCARHDLDWLSSKFPVLSFHEFAKHVTIMRPCVASDSAG